MTRIKEEEYEKKINISKFDFSCDEEDKSIPEPLPRKSFRQVQPKTFMLRSKT